MQNITLTIPEESLVWLNESKKELNEQFLLFTALKLFEQSKLTLKQAAIFADKTLWGFIEECKKDNIPIINYDKDDFLKEIQNIKNGKI